MSELKPEAFIDITDVVCPMTFVKAKVAMEELEDGQVLEVRMNEGEPILNVPKSFKEEGHKVLNVTNKNDGTFTVLVEKGGIESEGTHPLSNGSRDRMEGMSPDEHEI